MSSRKSSGVMGNEAFDSGNSGGGAFVLRMGLMMAIIISYGQSSASANRESCRKRPEQTGVQRGGGMEDCG